MTITNLAHEIEMASHLLKYLTDEPVKDHLLYDEDSFMQKILFTRLEPCILLMFSLKGKNLSIRRCYPNKFGNQLPDPMIAIYGSLPYLFEKENLSNISETYIYYFVMNKLSKLIGKIHEKEVEKIDFELLQRLSPMLHKLLPERIHRDRPVKVDQIERRDDSITFAG